MRLARSVRSVVAVAAVAAVPLSLSACTDDEPAVDLSAAGTRGKVVADRFNCQSCHSTNGDELTGPTWKGLFGESITLTGGEQVTIDAAYIARAIREPNVERRDDATGQMPTFDEERIDDDDLADLVAYIEDLSK